MDDDKLRLNTPLWGGFEGIIGRRDYFLNNIYIWMISSLIIIPYTIWAMNSMGSASEAFEPSKLFYEAPVFFKFFVVASSVICGVLGVSNFCRRLNDIFGEVRNDLNIVFSAFILLPTFAIFFPVPFSLIFFSFLVSFVLSLILLFRKGKITSQYPYDFTKEFNWGAYFGTWIWGLINKSYKTLWMLLLWFTPVGFYYQLVCGLKGNEWAYKNKGWTDVNAFNKNQEKQATIFVIIMVVVLPVLYFLLIFGVIALMVASDVNKSDSADKSTPSKLEKVADSFMNLGMSYFDSYEITEDENIFYTNGDEWKYTSFSDKKDMLEFAAAKSAMEREKSDNSGKRHHYSKTTELPRTKIYDTKTHVLLAEFQEPELGENPKFKDFVKAAMNSYKFYKPE